MFQVKSAGCRLHGSERHNGGPKNLITVYVDGLAEPRNPGVGTFGYVIYADGKKISEKSEFVGDRVSSNYAEYSALVSALKDLIHRDLVSDVAVKSDSQLLVNQMKGEWKVKKGEYLVKYKDAIDLSRMFQNLRFEWIPREKNQEADLLSRIAYEEHVRSKDKQPEHMKS